MRKWKARAREALHTAKAAWVRVQDLELRVTRVTDKLASSLASLHSDVTRHAYQINKANKVARDSDQGLTCTQKQVDELARRVDELIEHIGRIGGDLNNHGVELDELDAKIEKVKKETAYERLPSGGAEL